MIRQVLYSWGKLYFPWGIEDVDTACEIVGLKIADPLSGNWECVEIVAGANPGFDSAVFKYVPAHPGFDALRKAYSQAQPALARVVRALDPDGPETQPVNAATPEDYEFLLVSWVRDAIDSRIRGLGDCLCKRYGSGKEICAQIDILQKLKKELGL